MARSDASTCLLKTWITWHWPSQRAQREQDTRWIMMDREGKQPPLSIAAKAYLILQLVLLCVSSHSSFILSLPLCTGSCGAQSQAQEVSHRRSAGAFRSITSSSLATFFLSLSIIISSILFSHSHFILCAPVSNDKRLYSFRCIHSHPASDLPCNFYMKKGQMPSCQG